MEQPHPKYYLSKIACAGILRRAKERGKELPKQLKDALMIQAGLIEPTIHEYITDKEKMLCLADQGGERMDVEENITPTLRASMSGHPPLVPQPMVMAITKPNAEILDGVSPTVTASSGMGGGNVPVLISEEVELYDNHARDCRYNGPLKVAPTLASVMGQGGNNVPLVKTQPKSYCIAANTINRDAKNGGNGLGCQSDISYTLTTGDIHSVYVNQDKCIVGPMNESKKLKLFGQSSFGGYDDQVATLTASGGNNGGGSENLALTRNLVRRLTPLECERLQGFPDEWTNVPSASDSARYKALGNSVCIPCVEFVMNKIATFLRKEQIESEDTTCISTPNT